MNALHLDWQGKPGEFELQSSPSLAAEAWLPVTAAISSNGLQQAVQLPTPGTTVWYRLVEPL